MQLAIPSVVMRGGTSKGLYFRAEDLPADATARDAILLSAMGSPDERQIDGMGGGHPLTSKVAIVSLSPDDEADVDYLFLQVFVDRPVVSDGQNCGNLLAGVGPFAIEQGLVGAADDETEVRIRMLNSGGIAVARIRTPGGVVAWQGEAAIDGVPGTASPVMIDFKDVAGKTCGSLLPTESPVDRVDGVEVTCIDNGMPVVLVRAADLGKTGYETPGELESDIDLKGRIDAIRQGVGEAMNLGDVSEKTVPKVSLIAPPIAGGNVCTRTYIPHRVHQAIGVLGAASVAAACRLPGTVAAGVATGTAAERQVVEHPTGSFVVDLELGDDGGRPVIKRSALLRTARKLMEGTVFAEQRAGASE